MKRIFNGSGGRKAALILSLCLIFALAAGGTLAYLKAHTPPVTNTFTAAKSDIKIDENVENGEKSSIRIRNTGTAAAYVRVKLVMNWVDESGRVVTGALPEASIVRDGSWITGSDGIYYCTRPVAPEDAETDNVTSELLGAPIKQENAPDGCHLEVTVLAESIQAAPSTAVEGAWPAVKVADGSLTPATP